MNGEGRGDLIELDWPAPPNVRAFCTTRNGGFSRGAWSSFNLGENCGDEASHVAQNRERLCEDLPAPPLWLNQVHGSAVVKHPGRIVAGQEADASVSFKPGRVCAILTADCLPVFFCNRSGDRVAVAHAGWRGLANGVLQATIEALDEDPNELMAWMGPAIGPQVYEVGSELTDEFVEEFPAGFTPRGDRFLLDIYTLARMKMTAAGIPAIYGGDFCTFSEPDRFFSFRRDGLTGRMASLIWLDAPVRACTSAAEA